MDNARKDDLRWRVERIVITTVRRPGQYILTVSAIAAAFLSALDVMTPLKEDLADLPLVGDSEPVFYCVVVVVVAIVLKGLSRALSTVVGIHPFEWLAEYVGDQVRLPKLTGSINRQLETKSPDADVPLAYQVRPVGAGELEAFNQLNRDLFRFTSFSLPLRTIRRRNSSMYKVNPATIAFVEAFLADRYAPVGISHIVPLNEVGAALYVRDDGLRDGELTGNHMARRGQWSDAIVLFSMGLAKAARPRLVGDGNIVLGVYAQHLGLVLGEMVDANPGKTETYLYSQTERADGDIVRLLSELHFVDTEMTSGDGFRLWQARISLDAEQDGTRAWAIA